MGLLHKDTFVCLDLETTGLDPKKDQIIEVALTLFTFDQTVDSFETLIDPERVIPEESIKIHKIQQEMVAGKPKIQEVLPKVLKMMKDYVIVGHGIDFDITALHEAAKKHHIPLPNPNPSRIDTLRMARLYGESPINSLEKLREHFQIQFEGAHRAMSDVIVNIEVFKHLAKPYKTTEQIQTILRKPIKLQRMPLGKHKGRRFSEVPLEYLLWAVKKDFDEDLMFSIRSELRLRKQGGSFAQSTNPFSSL
ncbi:MAG: DUF3820 family protein [Chlamydiota bacterium]